jgi:hypothetical protein
MEVIIIIVLGVFLAVALALLTYAHGALVATGAANETFARDQDQLFAIIAKLQENEKTLTARIAELTDQLEALEGPPVVVHTPMTPEERAQWEKDHPWEAAMEDNRIVFPREGLGFSWGASHEDAGRMGEAGRDNGGAQAGDEPAHVGERGNERAGDNDGGFVGVRRDGDNGGA